MIKTKTILIALGLFATSLASCSSASPPLNRPSDLQPERQAHPAPTQIAQASPLPTVISTGDGDTN